MTIIRVLLLAATLVALVMLIDVHLTTRRLLRHLRAGLHLRPEEPALHQRGRAAIAAFEAAGYELAARGVVTAPAQGNRAVCLLRSPGGTSIAEVVVLDAGQSDKIEIAVESWISGGRLSTQTVQGLIVLPGQLKQVFPEASVAELLTEHERALTALAEAGRPAVPVGPDEVEHRWASALREDAERHPRGLGVSLRALRIVWGRIEDRGSVIERGLVG